MRLLPRAGNPTMTTHILVSSDCQERVSRHAHGSERNEKLTKIAQSAKEAVERGEIRAVVVQRTEYYYRNVKTVVS